MPDDTLISLLLQELQSVFGLTDSVSAGVLDLSVSSAYTARPCISSLTTSGVGVSLHVM